MKKPFQIRSAVLLALATFIAPTPSFAQNAPPAPIPAPAPLPADPPVPPEPQIAALVTLDEDNDEGDGADRIVRGKLRTAQNEIRGAQEEVARAMRDVQRHVKTFRLDAGGPNASRTLVVAPQATGEQAAQVRADLTIMARVLQKAASPEGQARNNFRFDFGDVRFGGRTDLDAMYLEGYGAVFLLNVDFPLNAPPKEEPKKTETKEKKDAAWEQARREVDGKGEPEELDEELEADDANGFDGEKVERLKKRVTEALRSSVNVRALKSNENVVVQVTGGSTKGFGSRAFIGHSTDRGPMVFAGDSRKGTGSSVLTFMVTRRDVENFSEGRLNVEEFAKKVTSTLRDEIDPPSPKPKKF